MTNFEVVCYCKDIGADFPKHFFDIEVEELTIFNQFLGEEFYPILIADLADHSSATEWIEGTSYAVNDKVIYQGCVFISQVADNLSFPTVETAWTEADKFTTLEYNNLWTKGQLRGYLAYEIAKTGLVPSTWKVGATGVNERFEDRLSIKTASKGIFSLVSEKIHDGAVKRMRILKKHIQDQIEEGTNISLYEKVGFYSNPSEHNISNPNRIKTRRINYRY